MIKILGNQVVDEYTEYCTWHEDCDHKYVYHYAVKHGPETPESYRNRMMLRAIYDPIIKEQLEQATLLQRAFTKCGDSQSE